MPAAEDHGFTQQASGVHEHSCTNLTLGGRQNACMFSKSFPVEMKAKEQRSAFLGLCSPSFTLQAHHPRTSRRLIYTPAVGLRELDGQIPCVRTPSQPLPLSYLRGQWRSAPWLIIFPCGMSLPVDADVGRTRCVCVYVCVCVWAGGGGGEVSSLIPGTKTGLASINSPI